LPWSKGEITLALTKFGVPSNSIGLGPTRYDARVLTKDATVIKVRSTWLISFKVIKRLLTFISFVNFHKLTTLKNIA
jgi:hypothetical protein